MKSRVINIGLPLALATLTTEVIRQKLLEAQVHHPYDGVKIPYAIRLPREVAEKIIDSAALMNMTVLEYTAGLLNEGE